MSAALHPELELIGQLASGKTIKRHFCDVVDSPNQLLPGESAMHARCCRRVGANVKGVDIIITVIMTTEMVMAKVSQGIIMLLGLC